jgi:rfaE bifunctional protein nucleotidyltransferase chain/domain
MQKTIVHESPDFKTPDFEHKIKNHVALLDVIKELRSKEQHSSGLKIGFTNGVFDILHRGHITYLAQAKQQCDILVVALNTDESVKRLGKGINDVARPINSLENRMAMMASQQAIDFVTSFGQDTPFDLIERLKPDVLIKGGDWPIESIVGSCETLMRGGIVLSIPFLYETSTTALIQKIMREAQR